MNFLNHFILTCCVLLAQIGLSQPTESVEIPMRDDNFLAGDIYLPNTIDSFPTILIMTPYGKFFSALNGLPLGVGKDIATSSYAFVVVDWRCRFASVSACAAGSDNGEDGYDVVEWIADQSWSNGKIGMWGPSALGNVQFQTARERPPHLVACVPEVAAPQFSYEKYYPGGSINVEGLQSLDILFGIAGLISSSPHYNLVWQIAENSSMYPAEIGVPFLLVGGWYDHNTDQTLTMFDTLRSTSMEDVRDQHKLLMGPWVHGGTGMAFVGSEVQGELSYPGAAGENVREALSFFDFHLRGIDNDWNTRDPVRYFQMGEDDWRSSSSWPPEGVSIQNLYLTQDLMLDLSSPTTEVSLPYTYDPLDPSPTVGGKTLNLALDQGPYDQSVLVESSPEALVFNTDVLAENLKIQGSVNVNLWISSDRLDTDVAVRLTDVFPDGRSMLLEDGIMRLRFRDGFRVQDTSFLQMGEIYDISISLDDLAVTILPGHRLRLVITSSLYPSYNRNMNTGGEMYPNGNIDTLVNPLVATNNVHIGGINPSHISVPVSSGTVSISRVNDADFRIDLFPNPTVDQVRVNWESGPATVMVHHMSGQIIQEQFARDAQTMVNVSHLPVGIYLISVTHRGQVAYGKICIAAR